MYKAQVTPLIGLPRFDGWAQVVSTAGGRAVWALSVGGQHARNIGRDLLDTISQKSTISSGAELYQLASDVIEEAENKEGDLSLSCGWLTDEGKSVFCTYKGSITLKRGDKSGLLLQSGLQLSVIEGTLSNEDVYIFATDQAAQFIEEVQLKLIQGFDIDTIVTSITPSLHLQDATALSALAFVTKQLNQQPLQQSQELEEVVIEDEDVVPYQNNEVEQAESEFIDQDVVPTESTFSRLKLFVSKVQMARKKLWNWPTIKAFSLPFISNPFIAKSEVYVGKTPSKKTIRLFFLGLVVVLAVSGVVGVVLRGRFLQSAEAATVLEPFKESFDQAKNQADEDPFAARAKVVQIREDLQPWEVAFENKAVALAAIQAFKTDVDEFHQEISGKEAFAELPIFFDGRAGDFDLVITSAGVFDNSVVIVDDQKKQGAVVDFSDKAVKPFSIDVEAEITSTATQVSDSSLWVLSEGLHTLEPQQENVALSEKIETSERLGGSTLLSMFGGSAYAFNPSERTIFKYAPDDDGNFAESIRWLRSAPGIDFETVSSMTVDGDIWLTTNTGQIFQLRSGNKQDFEISGLDQPFNSKIILFTTQDIEQLYVLEPAANRVVVLAKDGKFVREVASSSLAAASQIIVNKEQTLLLAISGSTVYQIEL